MFAMPVIACFPLARLCRIVEAILSFNGRSITTTGRSPPVDSRMSGYVLHTKYLWKPSTMMYMSRSAS